MLYFKMINLIQIIKEWQVLEHFIHYLYNRGLKLFYQYLCFNIYRDQDKILEFRKIEKNQVYLEIKAMILF